MLHLKHISLILIFFLPFILSSCFELKEEMYIEKDGKGTYKFSVSAKQSLAIIQALSVAMDENLKEDSSFLSKTDAISLTEKISTIKGISHVKEYRSGTDRGWSFEFSDINSLNNALYALFVEELHPGKSEAYYTTEKKGLNRVSASYLQNFLGDVLSNAAKTSQDNSFTNMVTSSAIYSFHVEYAGKIKSCSNDDYWFEEKNRLKFECSLNNFFQKKLDTHTKVRFK